MLGHILSQIPSLREVNCTRVSTMGIPPPSGKSIPPEVSLIQWAYSSCNVLRKGAVIQHFILSSGPLWEWPDLLSFPVTRWHIGNHEPAWPSSLPRHNLLGSLAGQLHFSLISGLELNKGSSGRCFPQLVSATSLRWQANEVAYRLLINGGGGGGIQLSLAPCRRGDRREQDM